MTNFYTSLPLSLKSKQNSPSAPLGQLLPSLKQPSLRQLLLSLKQLLLSLKQLLSPHLHRATPVAFVEEYDDGEEELLLDSLVAGATGLDEITTEPLMAREVNELGHKASPKWRPSISPTTRSDLLQMYTANISKEGEFRARKVEASLLVARAKHPKTHGKALARRIRGPLPSLPCSSVFTSSKAWWQKTWSLLFR